MAQRISRSAEFHDKEVLKFPMPLGTPIRSIVIDATAIDQDTDGSRTVVPAGTIMKLSTTNPKRYVPYDGSGTIKGILMRPVEIAARATNANEPAPLGFTDLVFYSTAIVNFTTHISALLNGTSNNEMTNCRFE